MQQIESLDCLERYACMDSPVHRIGARFKLFAMLGILLYVALRPLLSVFEIAVIGGFALSIVFTSGISLLEYFRLFLRVAPFAFLIALGALFSAGGTSLFLIVISKSFLSIGTVLAFMMVTGFSDFLGALRTIGVPSTAVLLIGLTYRYIFLLYESLSGMVRARESRGGWRASWFDQVKSLSQVIAALFLRAVHRGEMVQNAMLSRGFPGDAPGIAPARGRPSDYAFLAFTFVLLSLCWWCS